MEKYKTTLKEEKEKNSIIISVDYNELVHITKHLVADSYISGTHKQECDVYRLADDVILTQGFNPIHKKTPDDMFRIPDFNPFYKWSCNKNFKNRADYIDVSLKKLNKEIFGGKIKCSNDEKGNKKIKDLVTKIIIDAYKSF